jgi:hypothetical protein
MLEVPLQAHLGRNLKAIYQPVVAEAVPERLRRLLDAIERTGNDGGGTRPGITGGGFLRGK